MASFPAAKWLAKHVSPSAIALRTSNITTQVAAVEAGVGAALLPPAFARSWAVAAVRRGPRLAAAAAELPVTESWLIGHRALRQVPRIAAVWTFIVNEFTTFERDQTPGRKAARR